MIFLNPQNNAKRKVLGPFHRLWCLLFGWLYYAFKGMWGMAFISIITFNGLLIGMPLLNRGIVQRFYEDRGLVLQ